jgi:hypothetical protein
MKIHCPSCFSKRSQVQSRGTFVRKADGKRFRRFYCVQCACFFSTATYLRCYRQKKRCLNKRIFQLLCSGVSQRRIARILKISRTTVVRKLLYLSDVSKAENFRMLVRMPKVESLQFDDLETIEHTKLKPLSVAIAVEKSERKILGFTVSQMPAKGLLAAKSRKKYGRRRDERGQGWTELFERISPMVKHKARIETDENPHYAQYVRRWCPTAEHVTYKGQRGSVAGQGELKKIKFDPIFSINHTMAMCRANINRLFRRTWCTTKRPDRLAAHLELYVYYHNRFLTRKMVA